MHKQSIFLKTYLELWLFYTENFWLIYYLATFRDGWSHFSFLRAGNPARQLPRGEKKYKPVLNAECNKDEVEVDGEIGNFLR